MMSIPVSKILAGAFFILLVAGCQKSTLTIEELEQYPSIENGLVKEKKLGAVSIRLSHRPTDLLVNQELGKELAEQPRIDSLREKYGRYWYFILSLSANGEEIESYQLSNTDFGSRIQELAFGLGEKVLLTAGSDTLALADYQYQRTFGIGNSTDFLLAFEKEDSQQSEHLKFTLEDIGLGIGVNRFQLEVTDLLSVPKIQFNNPENLTNYEQ